MIWAYFAVSGTRPLANEGKRHSQVYQNILQDNVRVAVCQLMLSRSWVMQPDNDPKHQIKTTTDWLQNKKNMLFRVAQSGPRS